MSPVFLGVAYNGHVPCHSSLDCSGSDLAVTPLERGRGWSRQHGHARFEQLVLVHLDAAYNMARWLTRNNQDAEDVVQEAFLRAFKYFESFHGGDSRVWLLRIVRNTCYTWLQHNRAREATTSFDPQLHTVASDADNPETL